MSFFCINCKTETSASYKACPYCGEPITEFLRTHIEKPLDGKYKILSRLGVGGMGEVYKVLHLHLNVIRVVKLMRPSISKSTDSNERFIREARLATRIQHPSVATLFDFSTLPDGSHYMVWEHIEGVNLGDLLRARGFLSPTYACRLASLVLGGLEAIHRSGVVHRDISPENIMITRNEDGEETVKIIDLGIAKQSSDDDDSQTKTGMFVGKWKYCSPEQLGQLKGNERIDARADLYSFGVVFFEMLSGRAPFIAESPHQYFVLHSSENPPAFKTANPRTEVPAELEALVFRALEKDREKRFAGARAFATAVNAMLPHLPEGAPGANPGDSVDLRTLESGTPLSRRKSDLTIPAPEAFARTEVTGETEQAANRTAETPGSLAFARTIGAPAPAATTEIESTPIADRTLIQAFDHAEPVRSRRPRLAVFGMLAAAVVLSLAWVMSSMTEKRTGPSAAVASSLPAAAVALDSAIALNAFPWGQVTEIKETATGRVVPTAGAVTPAVFTVGPGTYRVLVTHPSFGEKVETVEVARGAVAEVNVELVAPESAKLPSFDEGSR